MRNEPTKPKATRTRHSPLKALKNHPFVVPVVTFLALFFVTIAAFIGLSGSTIGADDTKVVHLSVDGKQQIVPTRAATVGDLLKRAHVEIGEKDLVEPSLKTEISEDEFEVKVYRARSVTVVDGEKKVTIVSAEPSPKALAKKVGLKVYPEDRIEKQTQTVEASEVLREGLVAERVVIDRATPVSINLYGTPIKFRTRAKTVGDLLQDKKIQVLEGDTIQPTAETVLSANTHIFVVRHGKTVETKEEAIPMAVETINDPNLLEGNRVVQEEGSPGRKVVTYEIELKNGKEASRRILQEFVAELPTKQVVVVGTKVVYSNPSANVALGQQIASEMGWGAEFNCIYSIYQRESKWNHLARNRSSGAYGIPQALPGSKMGPGWETDPAVQIRWGIGYMVNRYGSQCKAQAFWNINHWY